MRKLLLVAVAAVLAGCPSISVLGSARTLDKGRTRVAVALEGNAFVNPNPGPNRPEGPPAVPIVEVAVHRGVSDRVELGGRLWTFGLQLDSKFALFKSAPEGGFDLAVMPTVGVAWRPAANAVPNIPVQVAVLAGYNFDGLHLWAGPRLIDQIVFYQGPINTWSAGASAGVSIRMSPSVRLAPELSVVTPIGTTAHDFYGQVGLAVLLGGG